MNKQFPHIYRLILLLSDMLFVFAGLSYAILLNDYFKDLPQQTIWDYSRMIPVIAVAAWILLAVNGLISIQRLLLPQVIVAVGLTVFQLMLVVMTASFLLNETLSRTALLLAAVIQFFLLSAWKFAVWRYERTQLPQERMAIFAPNCESDHIMARLAIHHYAHYDVSYCLLDGTNDEERWQSEAQKADVVVLGVGLPIAMREQIMQYAFGKGKKISIMPQSYELFCLNTEMEQLDDIPLFASKSLRPSPETNTIKRGIDIVVAIIALLLLWPLMLLVAAAIKLERQGPVFYTQTRSGKDEKPFTIYKFRSMRIDAEATSGPVLATEKDARITRVGNFIRPCRIDELPQLFNVILGEMSIVGPRPERPFFIEQLKQSLPWYDVRFQVKPGITGMAQVFAKYSTTPRDKLVYDLLYIQKCSFVTDMTIMLQTARVLLSKGSSAGVKEETASFCDTGNR